MQGLDVRDDVPRLAGPKDLPRLVARPQYADLQDLVLRPRAQEPDRHLRANLPVDQAHVDDDAAVRVVDRVEEEGA